MLTMINLRELANPCARSGGQIERHRLLRVGPLASGLGRARSLGSD